MEMNPVIVYVPGVGIIGGTTDIPEKGIENKKKVEISSCIAKQVFQVFICDPIDRICLPLCFFPTIKANAKTVSNIFFDLRKKLREYNIDAFMGITDGFLRSDFSSAVNNYIFDEIDSKSKQEAEDIHNQFAFICEKCECANNQLNSSFSSQPNHSFSSQQSFDSNSFSSQTNNSSFDSFSSQLNLPSQPNYSDTNSFSSQTNYSLFDSFSSRSNLSSQPNYSDTFFFSQSNNPFSSQTNDSLIHYFSSQSNLSDPNYFSSQTNDSPFYSFSSQPNLSDTNFSSQPNYPSFDSSPSQPNYSSFDSFPSQPNYSSFGSFPSQPNFSPFDSFSSQPNFSDTSRPNDYFSSQQSFNTNHNSPPKNSKCNCNNGKSGVDEEEFSSFYIHIFDYVHLIKNARNFMIKKSIIFEEGNNPISFSSIQNIILESSWFKNNKFTEEDLFPSDIMNVDHVTNLMKMSEFLLDENFLNSANERNRQNLKYFGEYLKHIKIFYDSFNTSESLTIYNYENRISDLKNSIEYLKKIHKINEIGNKISPILGMSTFLMSQFEITFQTISQYLKKEFEKNNSLKIQLSLFGTNCVENFFSLMRRKQRYMNVNEYFQFYSLTVEALLFRFSNSKLFPLENSRLGTNYNIVSNLDTSFVVDNTIISFKEKKELFKKQKLNEGTKEEKETCKNLVFELSKRVGLTRDWCKEFRNELNIIGKLPCLAPIEHNFDYFQCPKVYSNWSSFIKHLQLEHNIPSTRVEVVANSIKNHYLKNCSKNGEIQNLSVHESYHQIFAGIAKEKDSISKEEAGIRYNHEELAQIQFKIPFENNVIYIAIDFESTGTNIHLDEATQIAAAILTDFTCNEIKRSFTSLIKTRKPFSDFKKTKKVLFISIKLYIQC